MYEPRIAVWQFADSSLMMGSDAFWINVAMRADRRHAFQRFVSTALPGQLEEYRLRELPRIKCTEGPMSDLGEVRVFRRLTVVITEPDSELLSVEVRGDLSVELGVPMCLRAMVAGMVEDSATDAMSHWENNESALFLQNGEVSDKGVVSFWPWIDGSVVLDPQVG